MNDKILIHNNEKFIRVKSVDRPHEANALSNKWKRKGFRIRIKPMNNLFTIYRSEKRRTTKY